MEFGSWHRLTEGFVLRLREIDAGVDVRQPSTVVGMRLLTWVGSEWASVEKVAGLPETGIRLEMAALHAAAVRKLFDFRAGRGSH
jgi:hypothetical protein